MRPARADVPSDGSSTASRRSSPPSSSSGGSRRSSGGGGSAQVVESGPDSSKGGMVEAAPEISYDDPGAFAWGVDIGYSSKHVYRGIDLVPFTSFNDLDTRPIGTRHEDADSDIAYVGAFATYKGFAFWLKYLTSISDDLNPFFSRFLLETDNYDEVIASASYTRELVPEYLIGTAGFDFYYYPNDLFWGVSNQGMAYVKFRSPLHQWAQPFVDVFYNIAIDDTGAGLAAVGNPSGSDLVEGWGGEIGLTGGDRVAGNDRVQVGVNYSISTIYKQGYFYEPDGFSHVIATIGFPVGFGQSFTVTPSVSYVESLDSDDPGPGASYWNEPGWFGSVKGSWRF
jgi:hypothetical protein